MNSVGLQEAVERVCARVPEARCYVYAKSMKTGEQIEINADEQVQAASVIKICIMAEIMKQAKEGKFDLDDLIDVADDPGGFGGSGVIRYLRRPLSMSIYNLTTLMIIVSDNTATNMCIRQVGFDNINRSLKEWGCERSALRRYMIGTFKGEPHEDNIVTVRDLGVVLEKMYRGELVSEEMSHEMIEIMKNQIYRERIPAKLPEGAVVAHKTGSQLMTAHDAGIVLGPDYVVALGATGVLSATVGTELLADISRTIWDHFQAE